MPLDGNASGVGFTPIGAGCPSLARDADRERPLAGLLTSYRESEQGPARYSEMILYVRRLSDEEEGAE